MLHTPDPQAGPIGFRCDLCGEGITHDVARIDDGLVFHLSCFAVRLGGNAAMRECPQCQTFGATWNQGQSTWDECDRCGGTGYVAAESSDVLTGK